MVNLYGASDVVSIASGDSVFGGTGADTMLFTGSVLNTSINAGSGSDSIVMSVTGMTGNTIDLGGCGHLLFTTATTNDTVTVTNTTIGALSTPYQTLHRCSDYNRCWCDKIIFEDQGRSLRSALIAVVTRFSS